MMTNLNITLADLPSLPLSEHLNLPDVAAIYFALAGDRILYIGQSMSLRQRWLDHHRLTQLRTYEGCRIAWLIVDDTSTLLEAEAAFIKDVHPLLNGGRYGEIAGSYETFTERFTVRVSKELYQAIVDEAVRNDRHPTDWMRVVVKRELDKRRAERTHTDNT